ncbi:hypothetical protein M666_19800 [Cellulophaga baltica 18]|uniref:Response regulatory domain-containing protein n=1 Tax=Cellulophaga baltica 18 TaxID=1348584 RepID=A0AAU8RT04_9FLAO|nr:hypothetical protein M666_19800 [Cellulophaga baltica 18]
MDIEAEPEVVKNVKNEFLINSMNSVDYEMSIANTQDTEPPVVQDGSTVKLPILLLVEDNKELRVHLKNDLIANYEVKEAVNGEEGLKMVKKYYPDIIISDVMMPKMDGFEMCKALKREFETCHIPIILLTARTLEDDRIAGMIVVPMVYSQTFCNCSIKSKD